MTIDEFAAILAKGHVYNSLYHFTARENLPSIRNHGVVSKVQAAAKKIDIAVHGGNEWSHDADRHKGLGDYVNLCLTQSHPMCHLAQVEGRLTNPIYLAISPEVLRIRGVKLTLGVANRSGVDLLELEEGLSKLDTQVLYTRTDWRDPEIQTRLRAAEKCEILIPKRVPVELILTKL